MLRSMTGFGSGTGHEDGWRIEATVRTVNHRYLSARVRGLGDRPWLQMQVEQMVRKGLGRGEVSVWLDITREGAVDPGRLLDRAAASEMHVALSELSEQLGIDERPSLGDLIRTGVLQPTQESDEDLWPAARAAVSAAIDATVAAREAEGGVLEAEIVRLVNLLESLRATVEPRLPEVVEALRQRLTERIEELQLSVNEERLEAEIALLAERHDVQEELTRLASHFARVRSLLEERKPVGKELDFISQEMLREVNTLGSKVRDASIGGTVIEMKVAIEQLREQVQNVE